MPEKNQTIIKKVAVLIESSRGYGRGLIRGIGKFADENRNWQIEYRPRGLSEPVPHWLKNWQGDGILARINDRRVLRLLKKTGLPVIDLRRMFRSSSIPQVGPDDREAVRMAFEHFRSRGFQRFAFVGIPRREHAFMDLRRTSFRRLANANKFSFQELEISLEEFDGSDSQGERRLTCWLKSLPSRTAVLAGNDDLGLQVLNACRTVEIAVPESLAVAGIGNDECLCGVSSPQMTSIDLNPIRIGIEAATMLQRMMDGEEETPASILIKPNRIVPRESTNTVASDDDLVSAMIQYIRQESCNGIDVRAVVARSKVSRTSLENRFKASIGHTVFQEILNVRLERVQELLVSTDWTIKEITAKSGFTYPAYLMYTFQEKFGMTMKEFRRAYRFQ